jgi:lysophospholipase L1-like esterase
MMMTFGNSHYCAIMDLQALMLALALLAFAQAAAPPVAAPINPSLPTVFVVGDSTAKNTENRGWGDHFAAYFDLTKVNVVNRARAGRSSRTFQKEGLWDRVLADLKPGDYVLIQMGHNDPGSPNTDRARGSLPGLGDESKEFTMPDGKTELVHTYGWYMRKYIADTRAKGAHPILLSLTVRNIWKDGKVERGSGHYSQWTEELAKADHVPFIDLTNMVADQYEKLGEDKVKALFSTDHTHTSPEGAEINAATVAAGLRKINSPLAAYLKPTGGIGQPPVLEPANPNLPTLWLIGDSTVRNGRGDGANGQWGWGDMISRYFDTDKINVVNRAVGGLSSKTFLTLGHWDRVLAELKPGDFVMMQFGHNDNGPLDDTARARGTIKGVGDESREIDNPITGKHETVHTFGWYLRKYIADTRAKGATPIVCSLIPRKTWKDGKIARNKTDYAGWAEQVATAEHVPFIDLNERIAARYDAMGAEKVEPMFGDPHTHTSRAGAEMNAAIAVEGLRDLPVDPLQKYLR